MPLLYTFRVKINVQDLEGLSDRIEGLEGVIKFRVE